jgi:tRNA threonylcarbamoyladenosine biosynthesis protein TsaB
VAKFPEKQLAYARGSAIPGQVVNLPAHFCRIMLTLAVDTTAEHGSIALADENGVRDEVLIQAPQGFSHVLFGEIDAMLMRQAVSLPEIELFAAAAGPGSFTGVRVGLSAIKGLAEVPGKRAIALSNLEVLSQFGTAPARATIIDARRGEVYAAVYDSAGNQVIPEAVLPLEKFLNLLGARDMEPRGLEWISQGCPLPAEFHAFCAPQAIAGQTAMLAIRKARAGLALDPAAIAANYVRRSDAELLWKG